MKISNNEGHTLNGKGSGAIRYLNESICTRQIGKYFREIMKKNNHTVYNCTIEKSNNYLYEAVKESNKYNVDYAISHHLNCSDDVEANGVEVWIYDIHDKVTYETASRICNELSKLGLKNRGVKESKEFYWIKNTKSKAMIIEYLFCSNKSDVDKYNPQKLAEAVFKGLTNTKSQGSVEDHKKIYPNGEYNCEAKVVNVGSKGLRIRAERNTSSEVLGKLLQGSIVEVDYCLNNWFSIWENGEKGFIYGEFIELL